MNLVQPGSFLTLHYRLAGPDGADIVNTFADKPATLSLGTGELAAPLEQRLIGLAEGTRNVFDVPAGEQYNLGDVVQCPTPDGQASYAGVVRELGADWLLFDFNHPLAGRPVTFEVQLIGVL